MYLHDVASAEDYILPKYCIQASVDDFSCWGGYLQDEDLLLPETSFDKPGLLAFSNHGPHSNSCGFLITLNEASHLDGFNQIIGRVVRGMDVLRLIEGFPTDRKVQCFADRAWAMQVIFHGARDFEAPFGWPAHGGRHHQELRRDDGSDRHPSRCASLL